MKAATTGPYIYLLFCREIKRSVIITNSVFNDDMLPAVRINPKGAFGDIL